ncbi:DUF4249 family protein [Cytophaga sp. FL35]|uniref:DUF4249 family protein n=1 Tax=Cytophaga sp. FL35 TaxID=1904456 RepID=UPI0016536015|nr:DUF4249 family protein [Cytophaga sp. FL35]MBC7000009.1 DUF4249 domain-containing protein [Cytophaga sp. FL35]
MKNIRFLILLFTSLILTTSCEDVIDVDVQNANTRLVVEASLDWEKGTAGNIQTINLRTSTPFFESGSNTSVTGALVTVTDLDTGTEFSFVDENNGSYRTNEFEPFLGHTYELEIVYNGEIFTAKENLNSVPDLNIIGQSREDGFNEDDLEVNMKIQDPPEEGNSYFFKFWKQGELLPYFEEFDDEFVNGNVVDWYFEIGEDEETEKKEAFQPGDTVEINFYSISPEYLSYLRILINQIGGVGLFDSIPVEVKGNCVNETNPENYAYGYFRVTQMVKASYLFE